MISINTSSANPTKVNPRTTPPLKATLKALCKLKVASLQVLTFAFTAIIIPKYPEIEEVAAPNRNGTTVQN